MLSPVLVKTFYLFRAFFPSWRFFEDFGEVPALYARTMGDGEPGPWKNCLPPIKRKLSSVLLNPEGNFLLAGGSLLQHLLSDLEEFHEKKTVGEVSELTSYQLTQNLARDHLSQSNPAAFKYQFKLCTLLPTGSVDDVLISPTCECR